MRKAKALTSSYPLGLDHLVMVDCDPAAGSLTITRPHLTVQPGQNVIWCFRGAPAGWTPLLIFDLGTHIPFEMVTQSPLASWGLGAKPTTGPVRYRIALQLGAPLHVWEDGGMVVFSAPAALEVNNILAPRTLRPPVVFQVKRRQGANPDAALVVEPRSQKLHTGQIAEWQFDAGCFPDGKPENWQSMVLYTRFEGEPEELPDLAYGPFDMVSTSPGRVVGSGNNEVVGLYHFQVLVVSMKHGDVAFAGSDDPSVDNRDGVDG